MLSRRHVIQWTGLMLFALSCSGCVSTSLVYNPNVYQTGRVKGGNKLKVRGTVEAAHRIVSEPDEQLLVTRGGSDTQDLLLTLGLQRGWGSRTDIGAEVGVSSSVLGRAYVKTQLTPPGENFAASLMPAVVYINGDRDTDSETQEALDSWAWGMELHVPMSYALNSKCDLTWAPKLLYLHYNTTYTNAPPQEDYLPASGERTYDWAAFGFAAGFRFGILHPEISTLIILNPPDVPEYQLDPPLFAVGLGIHR